MIDEQLKCTVVFDDVDGVLSKMYVTGENPEAVRGILRSVASVLTYYDKSKKFTWAVKHGYDLPVELHLGPGHEHIYQMTTMSQLPIIHNLR